MIRISLSSQYVPVIFLNQYSFYCGTNILTWGKVSNVSASTATLKMDICGVKLDLTSEQQLKVAASPVAIEGRPFHDDQNTLSIAVSNYCELFYKLCPCLKYLSHNGENMQVMLEDILIRNVTKLLNHYTLCAHCNITLLEDILHPSLLKELSSYNGSLQLYCSCEGPFLAKECHM